MKCNVDRIITGTPEKKYYLIKYLKIELENILNKEVQIYLVISRKEIEDFFKISNYVYDNELNNNSGFNFNMKSFNLFPFGKGYEQGEITVPYKKFYNYFESIFHVNRNFEKEKDKESSFLKNPFKMTGGDGEEEGEEKEEEKSVEDIEIEKYIMYNLKGETKMRIVI